MTIQQKTCLGCQFSGMDMDMEPYCGNKSVLALRKAKTGRDYSAGLDTNVAYPLCKGDFWEERK